MCTAGLESAKFAAREVKIARGFSPNMCTFGCTPFDQVIDSLLVVEGGYRALLATVAPLLNPAKHSDNLRVEARSPLGAVMESGGCVLILPGSGGDLYRGSGAPAQTPITKLFRCGALLW